MAELTAKGRATRARILAVAADLVLKQGVAGTQIEDVRKAAGVSGSQMTHYFRDKRTLIKDVIAWQADKMVRLQQTPELDSFAAWQRWADRVVERQAARDFQGGCDFGSLAGQLVESDAETRADLAAGYEQWLDLFRRGLETMRARGELREDADPDVLAQSLLAALQGGLLLSQTLRRADPLRNSLDAALAYLGSYADPGRRPA
ncbi:TetR family transcriptional regulator [Kribbella voronezhensis]|uniref:TetR family transcriptional regulator n=1 Tax=Kribbella voronezhensis TaxID=2512212 RepID=A0A4R7SXZ5_9ACTN|nr:TetR/AcrR family transcriptional regulator [Kribbella voronezhensis]TDU84161.1 TetR family transcriptional regulator [Kribbella voronezhensis]